MIAPSEQLSVVIPMYNEAGNVLPLLKEVQKALAYHPRVEIVVVNDGSRDTTQEELLQAKEMYRNLLLIQHRNNYGQSVGVVNGVKAARHPWIVTLDGDGQNDPADIPKLIHAVEAKGFDHYRILVAGHRIQRKDSGWKKFGSRFANKIRAYCLQDDCPDTGCGIKLFARDIFLNLPHFNHLHRYLPALFKRAHCDVLNVPVNHRPRIQGQSKYGNWGRLKVGIVDLIGVAWLIRRPCAEVLEEEG